MRLLWRAGSLGTSPIIVDVLRGIAASLVVLSHADADHMIDIDIVTANKGFLGQIGVYLFFVLSGYLIWDSAQRTLPRDHGHRAYLIHRITRVVPLYYFNIALVLTVSPFVTWTFEADHSLPVLLRHAFFVQDLSPSVARGINPVLWTLTHEAIFYLLVPIMFWGRRFILVIGIASLIASAAAWQGIIPVVDTFLRIFPLFMVGVTLAALRVVPTWQASILVVGSAIAAGFLGAEAHLISALWAVALVAVGAQLTAVRGMAGLPLRTFAYVGVVSYSLYIWHYLMLVILGPWWGRIAWITQSQTLHSVLFIAACAAVSSISYFLIERPSMTTLRNWMLRSTRLEHGSAGPRDLHH
jgi:peptidoglycan/LPS O-acetylase OafA/YrhL